MFSVNACINLCIIRDKENDEKKAFKKEQGQRGARPIARRRERRHQKRAPSHSLLLLLLRGIKRSRKEEEDDDDTNTISIKNYLWKTSRRSSSNRIFDEASDPDCPAYFFSVCESSRNSSRFRGCALLLLLVVVVVVPPPPPLVEDIIVIIARARQLFEEKVVKNFCPTTKNPKP